jgi:hypothetical protein
MKLTNKEILIIKKEILYYLTTDTTTNQSIFDGVKGFQVFSDTDLTMVMAKVVKGLKAAQGKLNQQVKD